MPSEQQFRPKRITPKPFVQGPQTAVVVGPGGRGDLHRQVRPGEGAVPLGPLRQEGREQLVLDPRRRSRGRARTGASIAIPRIGQEVIVDFLEGDPDQPIITGRVYNAEQMPPYDLPANKTQTGIKTPQLARAAAPANFNEIRFEDKKGSEQVFIHAEKNQDIEVENDETHWVGHDRKKTIDHDETTHVKHDRTETVDNNETITVHAKRTETVDKNETITIHMNRGRDGRSRTRRSRSAAIAASPSARARPRPSRCSGRTPSASTKRSRSARRRRSRSGAAQAITVGAAQTITVGANQSNSIGADAVDRRRRGPVDQRRCRSDDECHRQRLDVDRQRRVAERDGRSTNEYRQRTTR